MKKIIFLGLILTAMMALYSCSKKSGTNTPTTTDPTITYAKDIAPIMSAYCTSCHNATKTDAGVNLSTKSSVVANLNSSISAISRGSMPPGSSKVSSSDLAKLKTWDRIQ